MLHKDSVLFVNGSEIIRTVKWLFIKICTKFSIILLQQKASQAVIKMCQCFLKKCFLEYSKWVTAVRRELCLSSYCMVRRCSDHYYTQVAWRNAESVMITWTNRVQNESISVIYNVAQTTPTYNEVSCILTSTWEQIFRSGATRTSMTSPLCCYGGRSQTDRHTGRSICASFAYRRAKT